MVTKKCIYLLMVWCKCFTLFISRNNMHDRYLSLHLFAHYRLSWRIRHRYINICEGHFARTEKCVTISKWIQQKRRQHITQDNQREYNKNTLFSIEQTRFTNKTRAFSETSTFCDSIELSYFYVHWFFAFLLRSFWIQSWRVLFFSKGEQTTS